MVTQHPVLKLNVEPLFSHYLRELLQNFVSDAPMPADDDVATVSAIAPIAHTAKTVDSPVQAPTDQIGDVGGRRGTLRQGIQKRGQAR